MNEIKSKVCLVCGDIFYKKSTTSIKNWNNRKKFCSRKCVHNSRIGVKPWNHGVKYTDEQKKNIDTSGLKIGQGMNKGKKFPERSGENHPMWKQKTIKNCKLCNTEMSLAPWQTKRVFCSQKCTKEFMSGESSPTYKGELGTEKLRNKVSTMREYIQWRKDILHRDNHQCVLCESTQSLEVDHIKRFYHIAQEYNLKTIIDARNCKELWDINNGRVLCRACHRKTDTFGTTGLKMKN